MEFCDSLISSSQSARLRRLTLSVNSSKTCWAALPPALCDLLYNTPAATTNLRLVLELRVLDGQGLPGQRAVYVDWCGDASRGPNILELPAALALCLGLRAGTVLQATPLPSVPLASSVEVGPVGPDDWEVLEANAGYLEGQILNQVGVLAMGQPFVVWVNNQASIKLQPLQTAPAAVVRLADGCEIMVAPKPRAAAGQGRVGAGRDIPLFGPARGVPASGAATGQQVASTTTAAGAAMATATAVAATAARAMNGTACSTSSPPAVGMSCTPHGALAHGPAAAAAAATLPLTATLRACVMPPTSRYLLRLPPTAAAPPLHSWLTSAAVVHPRTAHHLALRPGAPAVVYAAGGGALPRMLLLLVVDADCPPGHLMVAPQVLQALALLPHRRVRITQGPTSSDRRVASDPGAALPPLALHPVLLRDAGLSDSSAGTASSAAQGDAGGGAAATGDARDNSSVGVSSQGRAPPPVPALSGDGGSPGLSLLLSLPLASGTEPSAQQSQQLPQPSVAPLALALAVWLQAQVEGLQQVVDLSPAGYPALLSRGASPEGQQAVPPRVCGVPLASGLLVHLCQEGSSTDAGSTPALPAVVTSTEESGSIPLSLLLMLAVTVPVPSPAATDGAVLAALLTVAQLIRPQPGGSAGPLAGQPGKTAGQATVKPPSAASVVLRAPLSLVLPRTRCWRHASSLLAPPPAAPPAVAAAGQPAGQGVAGGGPDLPWLNKQLRVCLSRSAALLEDAAAAGRAAATQGQTLQRLHVEAAVALPPKCGGLLVTGPPGCGKTSLASHLSTLLSRLPHPHHRVHTLHVRCSQLAGAGGAGGAAAAATGAMQVLSDVLWEAAASAPSLVVLDDLHLLCPAAPKGGGGPEEAAAPGDGDAAARLSQWLADSMDQLAGLTSVGVALVATARDAASVSGVLRQAGRLDCEVRLPPAGPISRCAMLADGLRQRGVVFDEPDGGLALLRAFATKAEGYSPEDLQVVLDRVKHAAVSRHLARPLVLPARALRARTLLGGKVTAPAHAAASERLLAIEADLDAALDGYVPPAFWGVQSADSTRAGVSGWADVGGMAEVKQALEDAVMLPLRYPALVATAPLRLRTGMLLYGPAGTGKTYIVAAAVAVAAATANVRFISVKGPELLNKYIGASEAAVRELFARASAAAPCILFFDEFDSIAPPRGHDSTGVTDRVVNQLLTELDGVEGLKGVSVLAATSRPDLIDPALLRPGRLDRLVYCGPPADAAARLSVLHAVSRGCALAPDVDLEWISHNTQDFTGADLGSLFSVANIAAVHDCLDAATAAQADVEQAGAVTVDQAAQHTGSSDAFHVRPSPQSGEREVLDGHVASGSSGSTSPAVAASSLPGGAQGVHTPVATVPAGPMITAAHLRLAVKNAPRPQAIEHGLYERFRSSREPTAGPPPGQREGKQKATLA